MACADLACVLLAAGSGTRFGGNKLEARLDGEPIGLHAARTLATLGFSWRFAVHDPRHTTLAAGLSALGFTLIANEKPEAGQAHSLALGVAAASATPARALLVALGDMPMVEALHLRALIAQSAQHPDAVIASSAGMVRQPPALLPRSIWPQLLHGKGDQGARSWLQDAILVEASPAQLRDIDTLDDLAAIESSQIL